MNIHLKKIVVLSGKMECVTGLRIGSGNLEMRIGGTDAPILRHPHTNLPYIPGSSIKGKIRSLLELSSGLIPKSKGKAIDANTWKQSEGKQKENAEGILKLFGLGGSDSKASEEIGPTRCFFSDSSIAPEWLKKVEDNSWMISEVKMENAINRISGTADNPRSIERVPSGTIFDFQVSVRILEPSDEDLIEKILLPGLRLLEEDTLGGYGSRGYGRVKFRFHESALVKGKKLQDSFSTIDPFSYLQ